MRALVVAEKLLRRGRVTRLSEGLETTLLSRTGVTVPRVHVDPESAFETDSGSLAEREFVRIFARTLGDDWYRWIAAQVDIGGISDSAAGQGVDGRVDFLVTHPNLRLPVVVEIDGPQHIGSEADAVRDRELMRSGYDVLRLPGAEVITGTSQPMRDLLQTLGEGPGNGQVEVSDQL
jgi:hypothetical protein